MQSIYISIYLFPYTLQDLIDFIEELWVGIILCIGYFIYATLKLAYIIIQEIISEYPWSSLLRRFTIISFILYFIFIFIKANFIDYTTLLHLSYVALKYINSDSLPLVLTSFLYYSTQSSSPFVPWHDTNGLERGRLTLNTMYKNANKPLQKFLDQHCIHLLKPLTGYTTVTTDSLIVDNLNNNPLTISLSNSYADTSPYLNDYCCVYVFYPKQKDVTIVKCGSAINLNTRVKNYYSDFKHRPERIPMFRNDVYINCYNITPIYITKDYAELYRNINPKMTSEESTILRAFTHQDIRSVEQAVSSYINPTLWDGNDISLWHNGWYPGKVSTAGPESFTTTWETATGEVYSASSVEQGAKSLGLTPRTIFRTCNCTNPYWINTKYGLCTIFVDNGITRDWPVTNPLKDPNPYLDFNGLHNTLKLDNYYIFTKDMAEFKGPFSSLPLLLKEVGLRDNAQYWKYANKYHLIYSPLLGFDFYLVKRFSPEFKAGLKVIDHNTGAIYQFNTTLQATKFLYGSSRDLKRLAKIYIIPGKRFTLKGCNYEIKFIDSSDLQTAINKFNL